MTGRHHSLSPNQYLPQDRVPKDQSNFLGVQETFARQTMHQVEVIDSTELAKRLNVPETWVRSRTNAKRTSDPIPHLRLGRYVRFPWGSSELRDWLDRQLVSANGQ